MRVCAITATVLLMAASAWAQSPGEDIPARLKEKQNVSVTDESGRKFEGRVLRLAPDAVTIAHRRQTVDVLYTDIVRIDAVDDLKNGTLIGLAVGSGLFALELWAERESGIELEPAGYAVVALMTMGVGAAVGAGIDALIGGDRNLYQRTGAKVTVAPLVTRSGAGGILTISW